MNLKKTISLLLAAMLMLGSVNAVFAEEKEVGSVINADIGFVGGDFENVTLSSGTYYSPNMSAYTTYGSGHTISGLATATTGRGKLPIVVEDGNKVFKLQPSSLENAVNGKSLNNAFGFKLVTLADFGKIKDITGDVTVSFRMKVTDPECLDSVLFAVRPSHVNCGQHAATTAKFGNTTVSGSNIIAANIKKYFPQGEWVNVELTFAKSTFYDKADFAAHTWGGKCPNETNAVTEASATGKPVFYIRPYFNYGTTDKALENYSIYLDDFDIVAPTSAENTVEELETNILKDVTWKKSTSAQATTISEETKNGYDAWRVDPAIDISISGFELSDGSNWERTGQRANVEVSLGTELDTTSWYKLTAYVMVKDGVSANAALGTSADSEKTWVGKPILGIKLATPNEQNTEGNGISTRYRNNTITPDAKNNWQKVELCFKPDAAYKTLQLNATAGIVLRFWGEYQNMVLPTYWIRKDITLERVDTEYIPQGENIADMAAPYYLEMAGSKDTGWLYVNGGVYTAYPKQSGRPADVMSQGKTILYRMSEPLDKTKNYRVSFNIESETNRVEKAKVTFYSKDNSATLTKIVPNEALTEPTEMFFDTRDLLTSSTSPLVDLGDVTAIGITIDSGAAISDGSVENDVKYQLTNLKIVRIEPNLHHEIVLSGNKTILNVTNSTNTNWTFKGRLFVAEYDGNNCLLQLATNDVDIALMSGESISVDSIFKRELTEGSTVRAFLWEPNDISPIIDAQVLR